MKMSFFNNKNIETLFRRFFSKGETICQKIRKYMRIKIEINELENEELGFLANVTNFMLLSAMKEADLLIPDAVTQTVTKSIEGCLSTLLWGTDYTFSDII